MKKILSAAALLCLFCAATRAQDTAATEAAVNSAEMTIQDATAEAAAALEAAPLVQKKEDLSKWWTESCAFNLGFNQTALVNWAEGGYNNLSLAANIDGKANYAKERMSWNNRLQVDYGFLWSADKKELLQKSTDRLYLESAWSYKFSDNSKWDYTAALDFKTQLSNGFDNYVQDPVTGKWSGTLKSGCLAPAYVNLALGISWVPTNWFNLSMSPVTGGTTICTIDELRGSYGMPTDYVETLPDGTELTHFKSAMFHFGAQLKANLKASINDIFFYETQLVLFYDYINRPKVWQCSYDEAGVRGPDVQADSKLPLRINWDNKISWNVSKFIKLALSTWLIYDPNVTIYENGEPQGDKVQFKEFLAINFTYSIASKR